MIRIALLYPAGLEAESLVKMDAPFTPEAFRLENGEFMAGPDCKRNDECRNIKTQPLTNSNRGKIERRVAAVEAFMKNVPVGVGSGWPALNMP